MLVGAASSPVLRKIMHLFMGIVTVGEGTQQLAASDPMSDLFDSPNLRKYAIIIITTVRRKCKVKINCSDIYNTKVVTIAR